MHRSLVLIALGFVALAQAAPLSEDSTWAWEQFKGIHEKTYGHENEEKVRRGIFERNLADIKEHNELYAAGLVTYSKAVNQFTDMDISEVVGGGLLYPNMTGEEVYVSGEHLGYTRMDWREVPGVVSEVKNQGHCGSCWAFSATGSLEGQWKLKKGVTVSLSEQQLVDCSVDFRNHGCHGGLMSRAYQYIKYAGGIESEKAYPYEAKELACRFDKSKVASTVRGFHVIPSKNEEELTDALQNVGPVAVAIAANKNFKSYSGGVFVDELCSLSRINHGVLAVGFGTDSDSGYDYYIVKNSWGPYWGENGYIRMARNFDNMCGIATVAVYPLV